MLKIFLQNNFKKINLILFWLVAIYIFYTAGFAVFNFSEIGISLNDVLEEIGGFIIIGFIALSTGVLFSIYKQIKFAHLIVSIVSFFGFLSTTVSITTAAQHLLPLGQSLISVIFMILIAAISFLLFIIPNPREEEERKFDESSKLLLAKNILIHSTTVAILTFFISLLIGDLINETDDASLLGIIFVIPTAISAALGAIFITYRAKKRFAAYIPLIYLAATIVNFFLMSSILNIPGNGESAGFFILFYFIWTGIFLIGSLFYTLFLYKKLSKLNSTSEQQING